MVKLRANRSLFTAFKAAIDAIYRADIQRCRHDVEASPDFIRQIDLIDDAAHQVAGGLYQNYAANLTKQAKARYDDVGDRLVYGF